MHRDTSVDIATGLRARQARSRSSIPGSVKNFLFTITSRPVLGPTAPPIRLVQGPVSLDAKRQGREADKFYLVLRLRILELYLRSPIRLHWAVLNKLSSGINLPLPYPQLFAVKFERHVIYSRHRS